jgi:hypothetical protein
MWTRNSVAHNGPQAQQQKKRTNVVLQSTDIFTRSEQGSDVDLGAIWKASVAALTERASMMNRRSCQRGMSEFVPAAARIGAVGGNFHGSSVTAGKTAHPAPSAGWLLPLPDRETHQPRVQVHFAVSDTP